MHRGTGRAPPAVHRPSRTSRAGSWGRLGCGPKARAARSGPGLKDFARLELYIEPWNEAPWHTAGRVGYVRVGLLRQYQAVTSERRDMVMDSLLPRELA